MIISDLIIHLPMILFLMGMGALAGFFSGLLGIGGGLILVPGLYFGLGLLGYDSPYLMHIAIGTSLAAIMPTGFSSARAHWKRGATRMDIFRRIAPGTFCGSLLGVVTAAQVSGAGLQLVFGGAVLLVAAIMFVDPKRYQFKPDIPGQPWIFIMGLAVGVLAALMGIAGALLCVPLLVMCRVPIHSAVGTSSAIGLTVSLPAALGFIVIGMGVDVGVPLNLGYINLLAFALIILLSVFTAPLGARVAHSMDVNRLRRVFACFMVLIAVRMLYGAFGG